MVENLLVLKRDESVRLDPDRLDEIYARLGEVGAEDLVCRAIEELAVRLSQTQRHYRAGRLSDLRASTRAVSPVADQLGMRTLARVSRDLVACLDRGDGAATAAVLARLIRIGELSLTAIWDTDDLRI